KNPAIPSPTTRPSATTRAIQPRPRFFLGTSVPSALVESAAPAAGAATGAEPGSPRVAAPVGFETSSGSFGGRGARDLVTLAPLAAARAAGVSQLRLSFLVGEAARASTGGSGSGPRPAEPAASSSPAASPSIAARSTTAATTTVTLSGPPPRNAISTRRSAAVAGS